ncbi:MAG: response regulator [Candidatus Omnitrophica bacterium]|jgi:CheY-like chemotaxis protein|nr:response regulator [Candidatus Omnitrophota bacterium]MDD3987959.1 response regulator [Candidatus Omnitrophota bacterium]MDD4982312.1 response regulator [Candidatus Omnitrophota bacterium]
MTRILIVEDEEGVRKMYSTVLKNEGFEVFEAMDAIEASYELNKQPVDIMLLDIKMPQVYGSMFYDVIQMFHKKVKVIVASVYPVDEQKKMIKGAADYYDKSQGVDMLLDKIKRLELKIKQQKIILIIDDEPRIRKIYRHYLEENGYRIVEAYDGNNGLGILRKNSDIALIILDLAMPKESGFEIYKQIRKEFPDIKILIASVFTRKDQELFLPNADGYYDKSKDAAGLIMTIDKLININGA